MLKAIASALAGLWRGGIGVVGWTEQLLRWPFSVIFGSGGRSMPTRDYKPDVSAEQLLGEFEEARAKAAMRDLDRDGVSTVVKFANSPKRVRDDIDLSPVNSDARVTLLTMDEHELKALSVAGPGQIRKFLQGRQHGIFGVPVVRQTEVTTKARSTEMTRQEPVLSKVRSHLLDSEPGQEFKPAR